MSDITTENDNCVHLDALTTNIRAHPLHRHHERRPLVLLRVDPVDLCSVSQRFSHVGQAASKRGPVELQTRAVLFGLIEEPLLAGWGRRQRSRHGHGWRLVSFWTRKIESGRKMQVLLLPRLVGTPGAFLPAAGRLLSEATSVSTSLLPSALFGIPLSALFTVK